MLYKSAGLRLECSEQVATLWLDAGVLTRALLLDIGKAITVLRRCRAAEVLVVRGGRPGVFLTGPNFEEYTELSDAEARRGFSRLGQDTLERLSELSDHVATIAYIDGECSNAGLELALACDFRLAVARPETRLGFNVVDRGLIPCWGATQRLPRVIGPRAALGMILGGEMVSARAAKRMGLVDHAFGPRPAKTELWWFVADVQTRERPPGPRSWWRRLRDSWRPLPSSAGREEPRRSLIEAVCRGCRQGEAAGYAAERAAFAEHGLHPSGAWRRQHARDRFSRDADWGDVSVPRRIGVTHLDERGLRLATAALAAGGSLSAGHADAADLENLRAAVRQAVDDGWLNVVEAEQKLKQVAANDLSGCEVVFLTGPNVVQASDLTELDERLPTAHLAVTSPALPLARLAAELSGRGRVVGVHFRQSLLSPSAVEVVATPWTDAATVAALHRWLERCGQWPTISSPDDGAHATPVAA